MSEARGREQLSSEDRRSVETTLESYERIPYRTSAWTSAQPANLEKTAKLWGLEAAPADHCRVLELGCGDGGNLIPLAVAHPRSSFVGVDLAKGHVEAGLALCQRLGLENLRLHASSFVDFDDEQSFDYVIVHGLMSWVTPQLQELLFDSCKRLLAPRGVVFISYNTYPGWSMQHGIREVLRRHSRDVADIDVALERSRQLLDVLLQTVPAKESAYRDHIESIGKVARNPSKRYYFAHEYLEDENHPFWFRDFFERAASHELGYLADADLIDLELDNMPAEPAQLLEGLAEGRVQRLQLLDCVVNRKFRQSLLCHADQTLLELPDLARASQMYVTSRLRPALPEPQIEGDAVVEFGDRFGRTIEVDQPLVKAALIRFCEDSPQPIHFDELVAWARRRVGAAGVIDPETDRSEREVLAMIVGRVHLAGMLELQLSRPCWALAPGERPLASPLARLCAETGIPTTSLRHSTVALDNELVCEVLALLDGTRDRAALLAHFDGRLPAEELEKILALAASNAVLMPDSA